MRRISFTQKNTREVRVHPDGEHAKQFPQAMTKKSVGPEIKLTLGQYLASIRDDRGYSQRHVERASTVSQSPASI
jgi:hypothetical protein